MTQELRYVNKNAPRLISVDFVNGSKGSYVDIKFKPPLNGETDVKYGVVKNLDISTFKPLMVTEGPSVYNGRVDLGLSSGESADFCIVRNDKTISDASGFFYLDLNVTRLSYKVETIV